MSTSCAACWRAARSPEYAGQTFKRASVPAAMQAEAHAPREVPPVYVAATAPKMQALAGEIGDGCLTPSITTPAFVEYTRGNVGRDIDIGCTVVASIAEDREEGRDGAREIAGMYLANKVQNIQGAADTLLDLAGIEQDEIRPVADAMERGGRLAAKATVSDALLDKCKPIAGTPDDCIAAIAEYREAGCTHVMLSSSCGARSATSRSACSPSACSPEFRQGDESARQSAHFRHRHVRLPPRIGSRAAGGQWSARATGPAETRPVRTSRKDTPRKDQSGTDVAERDRGR